MKNLRCILFDLDDTLYNEHDFVYGGFRAVADYLGKQHGLDRDLIYKDMICLLEIDGRGKLFNAICTKYDFNEEIERLVALYRSATPILTLYEDAEEFLNWLGEKAFKVGLITDGAAMVQHHKIDLLGIRSRFHKVVVTYDLGVEFAKPHHRPYEEVIETLGIQPEQAVYIGDNPNKDFIGAKQLGIRTVRIIRDVGDHMNTHLSKEYEADYVVKDLRELKQMIEGGEMNESISSYSGEDGI